MNDKLNTIFIIGKLTYKLIFKRLQHINVLNTSIVYSYFNAGDY